MILGSQKMDEQKVAQIDKRIPIIVKTEIFRNSKQVPKKKIPRKTKTEGTFNKRIATIIIKQLITLQMIFIS